MPKFKDFVEHPTNPFCENLVMQKRRKAAAISGGGYVLNNDGEISDNQARMVITTSIDTTVFVKVFNVPYNMSGVATKLFLYLLTLLEFNKTEIYIDFDDTSKEAGISKKSIYKAVAELLEGHIISKSRRDKWYFFNPAYGYKGNRLLLNKKKSIF